MGRGEVDWGNSAEVVEKEPFPFFNSFPILFSNSFSLSILTLNYEFRFSKIVAQEKY